MAAAALDRRVWRLAFARAVNTMGLSLVMTFLGIYVVKTRGYPAWTYGVIALAANLAQSMSNAWAGSLSDRIGRRPLITTALFVRSFVIGLMGLQVLLDAPLWSLAANMIASSALRGCFEPVAYALVGDVVTPEQRISAFGMQRMGTNLGWAIGPALGGVLTLVMPYGAVFFIAAIGILLAACLTLGIVDPIRAAADGSPHTTAPPPPKQALGAGALADALRDPVLRLLLAGTFLAALLQAQMFATLSIYLTDKLDLTKANVGLLYTLNGAGVVLLQLPALRVIERLGLARVLPWAPLLEAVGFALIGAGASLTSGMVAIAVITCAEVMFSPAHQTAIAEVADPARRGRTYGVTGLAQMLGIATAPLLGGILLDTIGHRHAPMWLAIASIGVLQSLCFLGFVRRRAQR